MTKINMTKIVIYYLFSKFSLTAKTQSEFAKSAKKNEIVWAKALDNKIYFSTLKREATNCIEHQDMNEIKNLDYP